MEGTTGRSRRLRAGYHRIHCRASSPRILKYTPSAQKYTYRFLSISRCCHLAKSARQRSFRRLVVPADSPWHPSPAVLPGSRFAQPSVNGSVLSSSGFLNSIIVSLLTLVSRLVSRFQQDRSPAQLCPYTTFDRNSLSGALVHE